LNPLGSRTLPIFSWPHWPIATRRSAVSAVVAKAAGYVGMLRTIAATAARDTSARIASAIACAPLEISRNFLKSVEWAASHPSYIQERKALTIVPKEKR